MRMRCFVAVAVVGAAALATVVEAQGRVRPSMGKPSYFPLRSGYEWVYERTSPTGSDSWRVSVLEGNVVSARQHYLALSGYFAGETRLVRVDGRDVVTEANPAGRSDYLWYLLAAQVGTSWEFQLGPSPSGRPGAECVNGAKVSVASRSDVVSVPAGEFRDVVHLEFRTQCADAGPVGEWFAPGVGLIRRTETTFAGEVVSELASAQLGDVTFPHLGYTTTLQLGAPILVNNLMPPVGPGSLPVVQGAVVVRNDTEWPIEFTFTGCKSATVEVRNELGEVVAEARGDDGGCCACDNIVTVILGRGQLRVPFAFKLATPGGEPLRDGRYALTATLDTLGPPALRPTATATIEVHSVY